MQLADIPTAQIPMPCAPFINEDRKLIAWQDAKNPVARGIMDNVARITEHVSAPLFCSAKLRDIMAAIVERTGAQVALSGAPWKIEKGVFVALGDDDDELDQLNWICNPLTVWHDKLGRAPDWLTFYDEAFRMESDKSSDSPSVRKQKQRDRDAVLARNVRLWQRVVDDVGTVAWYNNGMIRKDGSLFPFVHPKTPGPLHHSLYHWDNLVNGRCLGDTARLADRLGESVVANVILHYKRKRGGKGAYESVGVDVDRYREQGTMIRKVKCSAVVISECPIMNYGKENPDAVANWAALVKGMNG